MNIGSGVQNTEVLISVVGRGGSTSSALACFTATPGSALWYFPSGDPVAVLTGFPPDGEWGSLRQMNAITLHRGTGTISPTGLYCCGQENSPMDRRLCVKLG